MLKPSKCCNAQKSLLFLGHIISKAGVVKNPEKFKAISDFPVQQTECGAANKVSSHGWILQRLC